MTTPRPIEYLVDLIREFCKLHGCTQNDPKFMRYVPW